MPFYYRSEQKNHGPFEIEEIEDRITPDTYVWSPGMNEWAQAKNVNALSCLFESSNVLSQKEESASSNDNSANSLEINHFEKASELEDQKESEDFFNEPKLNEKPVKKTNNMNLSNESSSSKLSNYAYKVKDNEIDSPFLDQVETELTKMIPWAKFYGIFQIITTILFLFSIFGQWNNSKKLGEAFATLIVLAIFSFIPGIIMLNISSSSKKFSQSKSTKDLVETIKTTSNYFRYIGVCLLIVLILGVIVITIALN